MLLAEIHTARQLAQHHEVCPTNKFVLQRRLVQQTVEGCHWSHVGKESEFLTHGQQTCLRTDLGRWIEVVLQVTHSGKEHGVGTHTHLVRAVRIRVAHLVDGMGTTDGILVFKLVSALLGNRVEYSHALFHNLRADTVALKNRNL